MAKKVIIDEDESSVQSADERARQGNAPFCTTHKDVRCESKHSDPFFTRYYCPVEGCRFSLKISRPNPKQKPPPEPEEDFSAR